MDYDLAIIGGGSGGLTAARLAASLGARVLLVEKTRPGGDCLYAGCIPSKSLIHVARVAQQARTAARLGVTAGQVDIDMARIATCIQETIKRVEASEQVYTQDVTVRLAAASFQSPTTLLVENERITSRAMIIATGSHPACPPIEGIGDAGYLTNEDVFQLTHLPASLLIVGGGPVGIELGQALARLGVQVTLLQGPEHILPKEEVEVSETIARVLRSEGITLLTRARVLQAAHQGGKKRVLVKQGEQLRTFEADELLLATGRRPTLDGLGLEAAGVACTPQGIAVNRYLQTSRSHIFALGDVIGGHLFTHVAAYQAGVAVRNALVGVGKQRVDYRALSWCTFTDPQAARVGLTRLQAQQRYRQVRALTFPWASIDRAQTEQATTGFIKLVLAGNREEIVGAHLVGAHAGELLGELALAIEHRMTASDLLSVIHPYPTLQSGLQQAMFEVYLSSRRARVNRSVVRAIRRLRR
ncbi:MAG TPA: NAD(P)/FAD-dependent oxidoreductase [Ktedonobacteraceae bacterium]|jgi:pyruvate/2-oxoglutarate dehydrogenase complex dihydrolipoamide dehydrogenase (E3) component